MTDDTDTTVDIDDVNLDDFEKDFFSAEPKAEAKAEEASEDKPVEDEETVDETEEDENLATEDDDKDADEVEEEDEDEEEIVEAPQLKKQTRVQKRIEQLLERERLANEKAHALELRLAVLEAGKEIVQKEEVQPLREQLSAEAPSPDAKDKDGNAVYELGEFDPKFIRDLTKFTIAEETKIAKVEAEKEKQAEFVKAAQEVIRVKWTDNLEKAEAEVPDIRDNIHNLVETFSTLDTNYGEYLASTIMNMDLGPQIMNYLSQNIGEAQKIVASGPAAATLALGRLEARLTPIKQEEKRNPKQVSKASEPPEKGTHGRGGKFVVADDTDDLDAFERKFFA